MKLLWMQLSWGHIHHLLTVCASSYTTHSYNICHLTNIYSVLGQVFVIVVVYYVVQIHMCVCVCMVCSTRWTQSYGIHWPRPH